MQVKTAENCAYYRQLGLSQVFDPSFKRTVIDHVAVTVEYLHDEDYNASDGGTGKSSKMGTFKLVVDF